MWQAIRRERTKNTDAPLLPQSRESIVLPKKYTLYESPSGEENFVLFDSGVNDPDR